MINKRKNVCYVIHVLAVNAEGKPFEQKFLSQHGISTKRFKSFAEKYLKARGCKLYTQMSGEHEWGSQLTISREVWKDAETRAEILKGISEDEKCY